MILRTDILRSYIHVDVYCYKRFVEPPSNNFLPDRRMERDMSGEAGLPGNLFR